MEGIRKLLRGRLTVRCGDIAAVNADVVVNAANSSLMGGGGVDGAIHRKGGPSILKECKTIRREKYPEGLPTGEAVVTGGGSLPARHVIHTVGPVWDGGASGEEELLRCCYRRSLEEAVRLGCRSIAFPAISTGVYGYPKDRAAKVSYDAVASFVAENTLPTDVIFVFFSHDDANVFLRSHER